MDTDEEDDLLGVLDDPDDAAPLGKRPVVAEGSLEFAIASRFAIGSLCPFGDAQTLRFAKEIALAARRSAEAEERRVRCKAVEGFCSAVARLGQL